MFGGHCLCANNSCLRSDATPAGNCNTFQSAEAIVYQKVLRCVPKKWYCDVYQKSTALCTKKSTALRTKSGTALCTKKSTTPCTKKYCTVYQKSTALCTKKSTALRTKSGTALCTKKSTALCTNSGTALCTKKYCITKGVLRSRTEKYSGIPKKELQCVSNYNDLIK